MIMPWIFFFLTFLVSVLLRISPQRMVFATSLGVKVFHFDTFFLFLRLTSALPVAHRQFLSRGD